MTTDSIRLRRPKGFTLIEVMLVSCLMALLGILLSAIWTGFGRPLGDVAARCRVTQEAILAADSLARDFGGALTGPDGRIGSKLDGCFVGRLQPGGAALRLCYDGGPNPNGVADWGEPDTVITYEVQDNNLVRWDENAGTTFIVARNVQQMTLTDLGTGVQIELTFQYRDITRTYTFVGMGP